MRLYVLTSFCLGVFNIVTRFIAMAMKSNLGKAIELFDVVVVLAGVAFAVWAGLLLWG